MQRRIAAWVSWLEDDRQLAPSTCKLYERTILGLERDFSPTSQLEKLTPSDLRRWLHDRGGSPSSYGNRVAALKSFYGYLLATRRIPEDPTTSLDVPKRGPSTREPILDLEAVLTALDDVDRRAKDSGAAPTRYVGESRDMAGFLAETGMRIGDACSLSLKPPIPSEIRIARRRRPDAIFKLNDEARASLDRLGGHFGIGPRALQRRFEKAGFHPNQLKHWYRINREDRELRDRRVEHGSAVAAAAQPEDRNLRLGRSSGMEGAATPTKALEALGRLLRDAEEAAAVLVRDARRHGRSWAEIARALSISEGSARERFAD